MSYRFDEATLNAAFGKVATERDLNVVLHALGFSPRIDEAAATLGEGAAATVVGEASALYHHAVTSAVTDGDATEVDFRPGLERLGQVVIQNAAAVFLRGVLVGLALAEGER